MHLNGFPSPYVPLDMVVEALQQADEPVDWLVMPRLEQPEVSVDCLTGPDGRVRMAVGRTKNGRRRGFTLDPQWIEPARLIAEGFGLHYLSNIQFRMFGDKPVLMDVNTRPAGGLHQLSLCGINAPWAAVQLALGEDPGDVVPPFLGQDYTVVVGAASGAAGVAAAAARGTGRRRVGTRVRRERPAARPHRWLRRAVSSDDASHPGFRPSVPV